MEIINIFLRLPIFFSGQLSGFSVKFFAKMFANCVSQGTEEMAWRDSVIATITDDKISL